MSTEGTPFLEIENVHKSFGHVEVLKGVSLEMTAGEVTCIIGPSGSGKSTLLRCVNHLEAIDTGRIRLNGEHIAYELRKGRYQELTDKAVAVRRRDIGMVFQQFNLFPHMTVIENLMEAPVSIAGVRREVARRHGLELLERVGLTSKERAYPEELSGGQQQRVAIARALAMQPKLMLFDEPTSALDPELVGEVLSVMTQLAQDGMTMAVVTHEMNFAGNVADTVVFMDDGAIVESGPPTQVLENPQHKRTQQFLQAVGQ